MYYSLLFSQMQELRYIFSSAGKEYSCLLS